jgi:uncharacterized membrane protein YfcA
MIRRFAAAAVFFLIGSSGLFASAAAPTTLDPWWLWLIILFAFTFLLGIVAVVAGVGGGVLFVPIVSSFFPFHIDFVRGAGLLVALTGALSAGPGLLKRGLANLKLALPAALIASIFSIFGAMVGLTLSEKTIQIALGATIVGIVLLMASAKSSEYPIVRKPDALSRALRISGSYYEGAQSKTVSWEIHRTPLGLSCFILIGFLAGMFGLGAGWANVPVFNLVLGAPLKISVATSVFVLSINDTAAAWVYLNRGAIIPLITVPSIAGMMLGTRIGVRLLARLRSRAIRWIVIVFLLLAGIRALLKGFDIWS